MKDPRLSILEQYSSRGVLVDTNILLLYFVGSYDPKFVPRFKRTQGFSPGDYALLCRVLSYFNCIVTTPNILTEVSNLSNQIGEPARTELFAELARGICTLDERYVPSKDASGIEQFPKLGLTDSAIMHLAAENYLVLTDDFPLSGYLEHAGVDVLNFNHIRPLAW